MTRCGWRWTITVAFVLVAHASRAEPEPSVCDVAPSTITFALGAYRGPYLVTFADGARLGHSGWQSCPPATQHREHSWEGCNFSLCDLKDGRYQISFADPPAAPTFHFAAKSGRISLDSSDLGIQAGFYGVDATGSRVNLTLDLHGYELPWSIAHWPGPFRGHETHGRAMAANSQIIFSLYPGVPYAFRFGAARTTVSVGRAGAIHATPAGPLKVQGHTVALRVARLTVTPPAQGAWSLDDTEFQGPRDIVLPAGAAVSLQQGSARQSVTLDANCHAEIAAGPFKLTPPANVELAQTCGS